MTRWPGLGLLVALLMIGCARPPADDPPTGSPPPAAAPADDAPPTIAGGTATPMEQVPHRLLVGRPQVTEFSGSKAKVVFETLVPTPPATVYYGANVLSTDLRYPRYRKQVRSELPDGAKLGTRHTAWLKVDSLEEIRQDPGLVRGRGGEVFVRVELYNPETGQVRQMDDRFRYRRDGEPGKGTYTLLPAVIDGPFVDLVTDQSAVVWWRTDRPAVGTLRLVDGEVAAGEGTEHRAELADLRPDTDYTYAIDLDGRRAGPAHTFTTAPARGSQRSFSFGFLSDSREGVGGGREMVNGVNAAVVQDFFTALYRRGVDLICFGGDLVDGYTSDRIDFESQLRTWQQATQPVAARVPVFEGVGNHEQVGDYFQLRLSAAAGDGLDAFRGRLGDESSEAIFSGLFVNPDGSAYGFGPPDAEEAAPGVGGPRRGPDYQQTVYSFQWANVHFVSLNTNYWYTGTTEEYESKYSSSEQTDLALRHLGGNREGYLMDRQLAWLERDLGEAQDDPAIDWIVVYLHEPPYPCGGHVEDAMYWGEPGHAERGGLNEPTRPLGDVTAMRDRFLGVLTSADKVLAVLCGDEHNYSRMRIDSTLSPAYRSPLWQVVSGGCGAPHYSQDPSLPWSGAIAAFRPLSHYCVLTVDGPTVSLSAYDLTGRRIDHVTDLGAIKRGR